MSPLVIGVCALTCAAAGALLPRTAYRLAVPAGEPVRHGCVDCGAALPAGVRGWLSSRDRCGACGARLGPRRPVTAVAAGVAGGLLGAALGPVPALPAFLAVALLGVLLGAIDVACHRLPDQLVLPALAVTPVLLAAVAAADGQWAGWWRGLLGFLALGLLFTVMALLPGGGFGMGDAKVGALLGWYLGWLGWDAVLLGALLPWLVNTPLVLALVLSRRAGWKTRLPFGPALLTGGLVAVLMVIWAPTLAQR